MNADKLTSMPKQKLAEASRLMWSTLTKSQRQILMLRHKKIMQMYTKYGVDSVIDVCQITDDEWEAVEPILQAHSLDSGRARRYFQMMVMHKIGGMTMKSVNSDGGQLVTYYRYTGIWEASGAFNRAVAMIKKMRSRRSAPVKTKRRKKVRA